MRTTLINEKGRGAGTLTTPTTRSDDTALVHIRGSELVTDTLRAAPRLAGGVQ